MSLDKLELRVGLVIAGGHCSGDAGAKAMTLRDDCDALERWLEAQIGMRTMLVKDLPSEDQIRRVIAAARAKAAGLRDLDDHRWWREQFAIRAPMTPIGCAEAVRERLEKP